MLLKRYIWKLFNLLNKYIAAPRMIMGYRRADGIYLANTRMSNTVAIVAPQHLIIADNVFVWHHSILECSHGLSIGEGCQIGANVLICTHSSHIAIRLYGKHYIGQQQHIGYVRGAVSIGRYCFIGPHVTVMPGSEIGHGSIVAAYSLVKGKFPEFAILAGNPAAIVGDTRKLDEPFLSEYPQLKSHYTEWIQGENA